MKDMAAVSGQWEAFYANMPDEVTLTVNGNHPIYQNVLQESEKDKAGKISQKPSQTWLFYRKGC
jgi:molecular chaperone HtpG